MNSRIEDVGNETNQVLQPLRGLAATPLVCLSEAGESIVKAGLLPEGDWEGIECVAYMFAEQRLSSGPDAHGLSKEEIAAIHAYTQESELYVKLNYFLRLKSRSKLKPFLPYLKLLLTAMYKLPVFSGMVNRGVKKRLDELDAVYSHGKALIWWAFSSTTVDIEVLKEDQFLGTSGGRTIFQLEILDGVDISDYSAVDSEREVLLFPCSKFEVCGVLPLSDSSDSHLVSMKQQFQKGLIDFVRPAPLGVSRDNETVDEQPKTLIFSGAVRVTNVQLSSIGAILNYLPTGSLRSTSIEAQIVLSKEAVGTSIFTLTGYDGTNKIDQKDKRNVTSYELIGDLGSQTVHLKQNTFPLDAEFNSSVSDQKMQLTNLLLEDREGSEVLTGEVQLISEEGKWCSLNPEKFELKKSMCVTNSIGSLS
mmetsp:Transcript_41486/g.72872  ORF Transcript_41486/g.72872 Transcript_41486/m.72872 type:complete len:420 (+) Transcript_41486:62-1321(+)